jgi:hypothetical protein
MAPGIDFVQTIEESVAACDVLIAVIGRRWLSASDEEGRRRLDNPEDFARIEIATALRREIRVIPVEGAMMPRSTELPDDLKPLVRRNALRVSDTGFDDDCGRLIVALKRVLEKTAAEQRDLDDNERLEAKQRQKEKQERLETQGCKTEAKDTHGGSVDNIHLILV